jgi:hypothetical protein
VTGFCVRCNEPLDSIKNGECLKHMNDYQLLKKDCSMELLLLVASNEASQALLPFSILLCFPV